jgi:hypothetical protein
MKTLTICWFACTALALALPAQTIAQTSTAPQTAASPVVHSAGFDTPVTATRLAGYRGGTEVVHNDMRLAGTTAGNTAINVATGTNAISAGAFSSMSGLPVVIQNSGANVLIQNAVILNLQLN